MRTNLNRLLFYISIGGTLLSLLSIFLIPSNVFVIIFHAIVIVTYLASIIALAMRDKDEQRDFAIMQLLFMVILIVVTFVMLIRMDISPSDLLYH